MEINRRRLDTAILPNMDHRDTPSATSTELFRPLEGLSIDTEPSPINISVDNRSGLFVGQIPVSFLNGLYRRFALELSIEIGA